MEKHKYHSFRIKGFEGLVLIKLNDIHHIITEPDHRNKIVTMADGTGYMFMNYSLDEIAEHATHLLQPNQSELIAPACIENYTPSCVFLKIRKNGKKMVVHIGRDYAEEFFAKLNTL